MDPPCLCRKPVHPCWRRRRWTLWGRRSITGRSGGRHEGKVQPQLPCRRRRHQCLCPKSKTTSCRLPRTHVPQHEVCSVCTSCRSVPSPAHTEILFLLVCTCLLQVGELGCICHGLMEHNHKALKLHIAARRRQIAHSWRHQFMQGSVLHRTTTRFPRHCWLMGDIVACRIAEIV